MAKEFEETVLGILSELKAGQANLEKGQEVLHADVAGLKVGQANLEKRQAGLEEGQKSLQAGQKSLEKGQEALRNDVAGLKVGQEQIESKIDHMIEQINPEFEKVNEHTAVLDEHNQRLHVLENIQRMAA